MVSLLTSEYVQKPRPTEAAAWRIFSSLGPIASGDALGSTAGLMEAVFMKIRGPGRHNVRRPTRPSGSMN